MVKENTTKQTEIGLLPEDWEIRNANAIFNIIDGDRGSNYPSHEDLKSDGDCLFLSAKNVTKEGLKFENNSFISRDKDKILRNGKLEFNDLIITSRGSIGNVGFYHKNSIFHSVRINSGMLILRPISANANYLYHFTKYSKFQNQVETITFGSAQPQITVGSFNRLLIPLPTIPEQEAIAEALTDADAWIENLEQLIAKKRLIKQGAIQELLMPKEDWEVKNIKEITNNIIDYRGVTPKKLGMDWGNGSIVALSAGNVKKGFIDFNSDCYFGSEELYKRWMRNGNPKKNDIIFTLEAPLGNVALLPNNDKYILSQWTILLQLSENFNPSFIFQILLSNKFQNYILESATGSTAQGIKRQVFEKLLVTVPQSLAEQTRIATILSDMDDELEALKAQLAKARQIKQGMMQELLTGKTRLI